VLASFDLYHSILSATGAGFKLKALSKPLRYQLPTGAERRPLPLMISKEHAMSAPKILSSQIAPSCPTCGKKMGLIAICPTCQGTIYEYVCSNDGDRLSWQPHNPKMLSAA
jgi:predicted RNA-binding Zn-ribbon protein involved in translation (DUF1610 family)